MLQFLDRVLVAIPGAATMMHHLGFGQVSFSVSQTPGVPFADKIFG